MLVNCPACKGQIKIPFCIAPQTPDVATPTTLRVFHVAREGAEICQLSEEEFRHDVSAGNIRPGDYYWTEGMGDWQLVSEYSGLWSSSGPPPLPPKPQVEKKNPPTGRFF